MKPDHVTLALSGGNALGAYQAGAYAALHARGITVDWVIGASIGAINGALIAGNDPEDRVSRLRDAWQPAEGGWQWPEPFETGRRSLAVLDSLALGQPRLFRHRGPLDSYLQSGAAQHSLFETGPLRETLHRLIDEARLNAGSPRFTATAVDLESGEDVVFDSHASSVTIDHVRASGSLPPIFPPLEIQGRTYVDGGLSANLPLDPFFAQSPQGTALCLAVDLLPLARPLPRTLGEVGSRAQDLIFAAQSRRTIAKWQAIHAARETSHSITLVHLCYADQGREVVGKAFDFSPETAAARWAAGERDMAQALDRLDSGEIRVGEPGLTVVA